jgi:hypothetical protein
MENRWEAVSVNKNVLDDTHGTHTKHRLGALKTIDKRSDKTIVG